MLDLTSGFNGLGKDNCKMRRETFKFWDLVCLYERFERNIENPSVYYHTDTFFYPLCAKFLSENMKLCLLFSGNSWPWDDTATQMKLCLLRVPENEDPFILRSQKHGWWWPGDARGQVINRHGIDLVILEYSRFRFRRVNTLRLSDAYMRQ